jgi:hypothetical protein
MQKQLSRFVTLFLAAAFASFAASAAAGGTDQPKEKVTKEYCQKNPNDARCKDMK